MKYSADVPARVDKIGHGLFSSHLLTDVNTNKVPLPDIKQQQRPLFQLGAKLLSLILIFIQL